MKKLLSLLSILNISGTTVPITIAASPYQKEENSYLEKLKIVRREENKYYQKVVITTGDDIHSSGVVLNNKVYFGSDDKNVYEYNPATGQQKVVITTGGAVRSSGIVLNNKLYFGSNDTKVYEYNPETGQQKVVIKANREIWSSGVVLNNKLYFGSFDYNVYEYNPATGQQKVVITTGYDIESSGVVLNNKVYFGSDDKNVYEYNPVTGQQKVVITTGGFVRSSGIVLNNKLYFGSYDKKVYEYNPATGQQKVVITTGGAVHSSGIVLNNKLYFGSWDKNVYEYDPVTEQQKIVIRTEEKTFSSGIVLNNKLYFGSFDYNVYEYNPATGQQKVVITTGGLVSSSGVVLNNKLYFGSWDKNVYEYYEKFYIGDKVIKNVLNIFDKNSDIEILNELNYLNPELDISQLEIINKTSVPVTIKAKNNSTKYFGEKKIYYSLNNQQNKIINLNELIRKAIFFKFRDENPNLTFKEIKNINTNGLIYSNVTATKSIEPIYQKNSKSICFGTITLFNNLSEKQNMKTPICKYKKETTVNDQITTGLSKQETNSNTTNMKHSWSFELGISVSGEGGLWPLGKVSTEVNTQIGAGGEYGSSNTKTLSDKFDFSNTKINEYKESLEVELPSQEILVNPNQKIKVIAALEEITAQVTLNLKQDINGEVNSKILILNNEEKIIILSIKEIMQKLKQYDLLPQEITINNDNTITFNGKANRSLKQGFNGSISFYENN